MPNFEMPRGHYLSCTVGVGTDSGGQTRAMLMRNRILALEAGVRPTVATLGPVPDHDSRHETMLERGLLVKEISFVNLFEHYRRHGWGDRATTGQEPEDLSAYKTGEEYHLDGTPWRVEYAMPEGPHDQVFDYLRPDGSPFVRLAGFRFRQSRTWPTGIVAMNKAGEVVNRFSSFADWCRRWMRDLTADDERAFIFTDSRSVIPFLVPMQPPHIHLIYLMHNIHVMDPRRWDSPVNDVYLRVLNRIGGLDAMVTLTHRQQDDIAQRRGRTNNMFVVPNPVDLPAPPADTPRRDPNQITMLARLSLQKRLDLGFSVLERVLQTVPEARLDIYGEGPDRPRLEQEIARRGLGDSVTLHGYSPHARETLWTSSVLLLTSAFEGYPLSTLESMSHQCPVVSFDIKYGPREQITDGVDGFVVPSGDVEGAAAHVVELLQSPELVERMGAEARKKAEHHGTRQFLTDWSNVVEAAVRQKPDRTHIDSIEFEVTRLRATHPRGLVSRLFNPVRDFSPTAVSVDGTLEVAGTLHVEGRSSRSELGSAEVFLDAIDAGSGRVTGLPLEVEHKEQKGHEFRVRAELPVADLSEGEDGQITQVRVRLRFVWGNRSWETLLRHPDNDPVDQSDEPDDALVYAHGDALDLVRPSAESA